MWETTVMWKGWVVPIFNNKIFKMSKSQQVWNSIIWLFKGKKKKKTLTHEVFTLKITRKVIRKILSCILNYNYFYAIYSNYSRGYSKDYWIISSLDN